MADLKVSELPVITSATDDDLIIINDGNITTSTLTWDNLKASIDVLTGQINFATAGTELNPTIIFNGDINTGIYSPGADQLSFVTNGDTALYIDSDGRLGIGNENPGSFDPSANGIVTGSTVGADFGITIAAGNNYRSSVYFADGTSDGARNAGQIAYHHSVDEMSLSVANAEVARVTNEGHVGIGTDDPDDLIHISAGVSGVTTPVPNVQGVIVEADNTTNAAVQFHTSNAQTAGVYFGDPQNADASHVVYDHATDMLGIGVGGSEQIKIDSTGSVGLNTSPVLGNLVTLGGVAIGLPSFSAFAGEVIIGQTVTDSFTYYQTEAQTQAADFNLDDLYHFRAVQSTIGAASSIDRQYAFYVDAGLTGAGTNYGYYSALTGSDNYSFYASGNSKVYFNASQFDVANGGDVILNVVGGMVSTTNGIVIGGGDTGSRPPAQEGLIRYNTDGNTWEGWNGSGWIALGATSQSLQQVTDIGAHTTNSIEVGNIPGVADITLDESGLISTGTATTTAGTRSGFDGTNGIYHAYVPNTTSNLASIINVTTTGSGGEVKFEVQKDGSAHIGAGNIDLNADGTATFAGNISGTISNATAAVDSTNAANVATSALATDASFGLAFLSATTGNVAVHNDAELTYNPSTNSLAVGGVSASGTISSSENTITAGAWDLNSGNFWVCGAVTVPNPTNATTGTSGLIRLTAAPSGWGSNIKHPGGAAEEITAFPAIVPFYVQDASNILLGKAIQGIS